MIAIQRPCSCHILPLAWLAVMAAAIAACGPWHIRTPESPARAVIVLLPDPDSGAVGRVIVSNDAGAVELGAARASTRVTGSNQPSTPAILSEREAEALFGDLLSWLPPAPRHFTLYFRFESDDLMPESRDLFPEIQKAVKGLPAPDVLVIGHTDTLGTAASNLALGLRRARTVRNLLVEAGLDAAAIDVASHGESDLLVPTPDETPEPRNRRVEITVR